MFTRLARVARRASLNLHTRPLTVDSAMRDLVRNEMSALKREVDALRESHARLEAEVALLRDDSGGGVATVAMQGTSGAELLGKAQPTSRARSPPCASGEPVLWHNAKCSKSRAALALLEESGRSFKVRAYLEDTPSFEELCTLRKQLNIEPIDWARTMDPAWCEHFNYATVYDDLLPEEDDILRAMAKLPIMIERPILICGERAVVGRPPEAIMELLADVEE